MERYRTIIDEWSAFKHECARMPIKTVRKNPIKAGEEFFMRLGGEFQFVERSEWNKNIFRLPGAGNPGNSAMHWLGEYYVQEESAALPVEALDPGPGEKILDLCAAPGGKTTQIAGRVDNDGKLIANDKSARRMQSLTANVYRTGSACVSTTNYDGRSFPGSEEYDRVLVDAPCSGEGDRARRNFLPAEREESRNLSELQKDLLERAAGLTKEGGKVVYSTCTISPFENEAVVEHALDNTELRLESFSPQIRHVSGVNAFEDREFELDASKLVRVYPQFFNSGVIFVAKFTK
ncbi:MAG: RsmB/NOP family class I SAM-dependent RNA methyltransferase [Candidatus Nanohaloarchaea archaeon]